MKNIVISEVEPTKKDLERVRSIDFRTDFGMCTFKGNQDPFESVARKMAKLIKDPVKLVRRAKALVSVWGSYERHAPSNDKPECVWRPFKERLTEMGSKVYRKKNGTLPCRVPLIWSSINLRINVER